VRADRGKAALEVIRARLKRMMPTGEVTATLQDEKTLVVLSRNRKKKVVERIKWIVTKPGMLEFRISVERMGPGIALGRALALFQRAIKKGIPLDQARTIPATALTARERKRYPHGLRWFRLHAKAHKAMKLRTESLEDGTRWFLVQLGSHNLTEGDLHKVSVSLSTSDFSETYAIHFRVRENAQERMAALTAIDESELSSTHMAMVIDGQVLTAPKLHSALRSSGEITGGFTEEEANALAAPLRSAVLDPVPVFVWASAQQFAPKAPKKKRREVDAKQK